MAALMYGILFGYEEPITWLKFESISNKLDGIMVSISIWHFF